MICSVSPKQPLLESDEKERRPYGRRSFVFATPYALLLGEDFLYFLEEAAGGWGVFYGYGFA
jgi:hypothetical protein